MRDIETVDFEQRLVAALRRSARERGGTLPSIDVADAVEVIDMYGCRLISNICHSHHLFNWLVIVDQHAVMGGHEFYAILHTRTTSSAIFADGLGSQTNRGF
jgi:hypothetical protein